MAAEANRGPGRPVTGRKIVVQVALDEEHYATLAALADKAGEAISATGRRVMIAGLGATPAPVRTNKKRKG